MIAFARLSRPRVCGLSAGQEKKHEGSRILQKAERREETNLIIECICGKNHGVSLDETQPRVYTVGRLHNPVLVGLEICSDDDSYLSRIQCHLRKEDGRWFLYDGCPGMDVFKELAGKPSAGGTYLNRKRITRTEIRPGDEIHFVACGTGGQKTRYKGRPAKSICGFAYLGKFCGDDARAPERLEKFLKEIGPARQAPLDNKILQEKFRKLPELLRRIAGKADPDEALNAVLTLLLKEIPAAGAAAVLLKRSDSTASVRYGMDRMGQNKELAFSQTIVSKVLREKRSFVTGNVLRAANVDPELAAAKSIPRIGVNSAIAAPLWAGEEDGEILGVLYIDNREQEKPLTDDDVCFAIVISVVAQLQLLIERYSQQSIYRANLERFFPPQAIEWISKRSARGKTVDLYAREGDVTVIFIDIAESTKLSSELTPKQFYEHLTPHYYETVCEAVFQNGGCVNSFMGDGVMATFCDLLDKREYFGKEVLAKKKDCAAGAVKAALEIVLRWPAVRKRESLPDSMKVRMGVHTGRGVMGNLGYEKRMEFTIVGMDVNIASRLEKYAEGDGIVISDATHHLVKDLFNCEDIGEKEIRGVSEGDSRRLRLWKVIGEKE